MESSGRKGLTPCAPDRASASRGRTTPKIAKASRQHLVAEEREQRTHDSGASHRKEGVIDQLVAVLLRLKLEDGEDIAVARHCKGEVSEAHDAEVARSSQ